jgi:hypothetical protein
MLRIDFKHILIDWTNAANSHRCLFMVTLNTGNRSARVWSGFEGGLRKPIREVWMMYGCC